MTYGVIWVTSLPFITLLQWSHGIVKYILDVHFRISVELIVHPGTFWLFSYEYYEFGHTDFHILFAYSRE